MNAPATLVNEPPNAGEHARIFLTDLAGRSRENDPRCGPLGTHAANVALAGSSVSVWFGMALLLTGRPGVGKTTVVRTAALKLGGFRLVGFYTEEIRAGRERRGFRLVTFGGEEAIIAHVDLPPPRVSKYGVDVAMLDRFAATLGDPGDRSAIYLVDEIGKMECLSMAFVHAMRRLIESGVPLIATVAQRGSGFIDEVKRRHDAVMWTVTEATREMLPDRVVAWIVTHRASGPR
jgi:nucleoside-triphosphatase